MSILYNEVQPENNSPNGFTDNQTISFVIKGDGSKMVKNSMRLDFDLDCCSTFVSVGGANTLVNPNTRIGVNNKIGGHAFISECMIETQASGVLETISDYSRVANVLSTASMSEEQYYTQMAQAEGRQSCVDAARYVVQAVAPNANIQTGGGAPPGGRAPAGATFAERLAVLTAQVNQDLRPDAANDKTSPAQFSIKPYCCLNRAIGDDVSLAKLGFIRVEFTLSRSQVALMGAEATGTAGFVMRNPRLRYISYPDNGKQGKVMMNTVVSLRSTANSQFHNVQARVPLQNASGVVISYIDQARARDTREDSLALEQYPSLDRLEYLFSDNNQNYIQYPLEDKDTMVKLGIQALSDSGMHQATVNRLVANQGTLHGLSFQQFIDLTKQKFSVQLTSSSVHMATSPVELHLMFLGMLEL